MFEEMITKLRQGEVTQPDSLRQRFDRALIKKLGVIKTPPSFWTADKKINPSAKELLWAAVLLEDRENFIVVEGIISTELNERQKASGQDGNTLTYKNYREEYIQELLQLAPSLHFRELIQEKINKVI
ncbi:MAG: hypothetical protein JRF02_03750 [Deltaproteobacteria bacterium]|jgi:hypothetical protein|nr:hypothetical protein [Deltaproteobacteria bacterium]